MDAGWCGGGACGGGSDRARFAARVVCSQSVDSVAGSIRVKVLVKLNVNDHLSKQVNGAYAYAAFDYRHLPIGGSCVYSEHVRGMQEV